MATYFICYHKVIEIILCVCVYMCEQTCCLLFRKWWQRKDVDEDSPEPVNIIKLVSTIM